MWIRVLALLSFLTTVWALSPARANRPWKPSASIPPAEGSGIRIKGPDAATLKQFRKAYAEGRRLLAAGQYAKANKSLARAIRLNPDHVGARVEHIRTLLTLGYLNWNPVMIQQAQIDARHALRISPDDKRLVLMTELLDALRNRMRMVKPRKKRRARKK